MKKTNARIFASLLRRIAREIEAFSDTELQDMEESTGPLLSQRGSGNRKRVEEAWGDKQLDVNDVVEKMRSLKGRDEGVALLREAAPTKSKLILVAKALDVPVLKQNTAEEIVAKIVETTIGFRIRSAAIRGGHGESRGSSVQNGEPDDGAAREVAGGEKPSGQTEG
jgi:hypothetical protein